MGEGRAVCWEHWQPHRGGGQNPQVLSEIRFSHGLLWKMGGATGPGRVSRADSSGAPQAASSHYSASPGGSATCVGTEVRRKELTQKPGWTLPMQGGVRS